MNNLRLKLSDNLAHLFNRDIGILLCNAWYHAGLHQSIDARLTRRRPVISSHILQQLMIGMSRLMRHGGCIMPLEDADQILALNGTGVGTARGRCFRSLHRLIQRIVNLNGLFVPDHEAATVNATFIGNAKDALFLEGERRGFGRT